jgi:hypothetical protein
VVAALLTALPPFSPLLGIGGALAPLLVTGIMAYLLDSPDTDLASFVAIFCLEKLSFQVGSIVGCIRQRTFGPLVPRIKFI